MVTIKEGCSTSRKEIASFLEEHKIQTRLLFSGNLVDHPCFDGIRGTDAYRVVGKMSSTDFIIKNSFWIGVYPGMTKDKLKYMADILAKGIEGNVGDE